ncbi:hypothetical protein K490DRAFT_67977 [Saccharata proteae CBS 121410]|uniref:Uncharacterized protein n=1 Tax=Saccharata proteae CBS 121410 TaxID=1314787 RepID=A0A9P4HRH3_9PEZI|nr:hypothetical protein K490DRAFT_67977 [Saccharata proteae CBS 121410]
MSKNSDSNTQSLATNNKMSSSSATISESVSSNRSEDIWINQADQPMQNSPARSTEAVDAHDQFVEDVQRIEAELAGSDSEEPAAEDDPFARMRLRGGKDGGVTIPETIFEEEDDDDDEGLDVPRLADDLLNFPWHWRYVHDWIHGGTGNPNFHPGPWYTSNTNLVGNHNNAAGSGSNTNPDWRQRNEAWLLAQSLRDRDFSAASNILRAHITVDLRRLNETMRLLEAEPNHLVNSTMRNFPTMTSDAESHRVDQVAGWLTLVEGRRRLLARAVGMLDGTLDEDLDRYLLDSGNTLMAIGEERARVAGRREGVNRRNWERWADHQERSEDANAGFDFGTKSDRGEDHMNPSSEDSAESL